jgi:hypothetical protein
VRICSTPKSVVRLVGVVPNYTIADGEYTHVAVGRPAAFGFALQPSRIRPARPGAAAVVQDKASVPTSTITGTVIRPTGQAPAVLDGGCVRPLLATSDDAWTAGDVLAVTGRLVVEPLPLGHRCEAAAGPARCRPPLVRRGPPLRQ